MRKLLAAAAAATVLLGQAAQAECANDVCTDIFVDWVQVSPASSTVLVWTSGDESLISSSTCDADSGDRFKFNLSATYADEVYSTLITALAAGKKVEMWVDSDGTGVCFITAVRLLRQ